MILKTKLLGHVYDFKSVREVMAKANEEKSGDRLAGIAAENAEERVAAKVVLANLTLADHRLLDLVWQAEPVSSPQLCKLAEEALGWKRTTTYTVIKRLCGKGCLKNENAIVTSLVDRATVQQADGQEVLQRSFNGSLPNFLAAFLRAGSVSDQEAAQLEELLEEYKNR